MTPRTADGRASRVPLRAHRAAPSRALRSGQRERPRWKRCEPSWVFLVGVFGMIARFADTEVGSRPNIFIETWCRLRALNSRPSAYTTVQYRHLSAIDRRGASGRA